MQIFGLLAQHDRYDEVNMPHWFCDKVGTTIPQRKGQKTIQSRIPRRLKDEPRLKSEIIAILHATGYNPLRYKCPNILSPFQIGIKDKKSIGNFLQITYKSVSEAKNRAIAIALITSDPSKGNDSFVHLFSEQ